MNRLDAVEQTHKAIGEEIRFEDSKGVWTFKNVWRQNRHPNGESDFNLYLSLRREAQGLAESKAVFMREAEGIDVLKKRIKSSLGYTPSVRVLEGLMTLLNQMKAAYEEEDRFYASADADEARNELDKLFDRAIARFEAGEDVYTGYQRRMPAMEHYLTREELERATEAQKAINGHAYVMPMSQFEKTGHLAVLNQRIADRIQELKKAAERLAYRSREAKILAKFETDIDFRALVAQAIAASKEIRADDVDHELAQRLFGYARNIDDYRKCFAKYGQMMSGFGLEWYEGSYLVRLGKSYIAEGGMLPVVAPPFERDPEGIYYNDVVHDGFQVLKVERIGRKYMQPKRGTQMLKNKVQLYDRVTAVQDPDSVEAHLRNEMIRLHNQKVVPLAYEKSVLNVVGAILKQRFTKPRQLRERYAEREAEATCALAKEAYALIGIAVQVHELKEQIKAMEKLLYLSTCKENHERYMKELDPLLSKLDRYGLLEVPAATGSA